MIVDRYNFLVSKPTGEIIVVKLTDGKDLYQKTYSVTIPNTSDGNLSVASNADLNYENIFIVGGYIYAENIYVPINYYDNLAKYSKTYISTAANFKIPNFL